MPATVGWHKSVITSIGLVLAVLAGIMISTLSMGVLADRQFGIFLIFSLLLALTGIALAQSVDRDNASHLTQLFLMAFVIRIVMTLILYQHFMHINGYPFVGSWGADDQGYHYRATRLAEQWAAGNWYFPSHDSAAYDSLTALFYFTFGSVPLVVRALNCFAGAVSTVFTASLAHYIFGARIGQKAGRLVAFMPDLLLFSAIQYRDSLLTAMILYLIWAFRWNGPALRSYWHLLISLVVFFGFLFMYRNAAPIMLGVLGTTVVFQMWSPDVKQSSSRVKYSVLLLSCVLLGIVLVQIVDTLYAQSIWDVAWRIESSQQHASRILAESPTDSLSALLYTDQGGVQGILTAPVRFLFPLILPIPTPSFWGSLELDAVLLSMGSLVWYIMLPCAGYGLIWALKHDFKKAFPIYAFPFFSLVGLFLMYYSGSIRYRTQFMPLLWILVALGLDRLSHWHMEYMLMLISLGIVFAGYIAFKGSL
ncbi:MAG TPA: hypothetical protein PKH77_06000 [Anaerolineae bacterium]|nr:hypothetical protein [Anaerolineae bacterium]